MKRKTRAERKGEKFDVGGTWTKEEEVNTPTETIYQNNFESRKDNVSSKSSIDQIRAELFEERMTASVEPEYWDESHNWDLENEPESEEYWHFVGRYE